MRQNKPTIVSRRIKTAIEMRKIDEKKINTRLAEIIWPDSAHKTQLKNLGNLKEGMTEPNVKIILILCRELGKDANYFYGLD